MRTTAPTRTLPSAGTWYGLYIAALYAAIRHAATVNVGSAELHRWLRCAASSTNHSTVSGYRRRATRGSAEVAGTNIVQECTAPESGTPGSDQPWLRATPARPTQAART